MHFDCFIQIIPSDFTLFSAYLALKNAFFICFGKQIYYNYLAVIYFIYMAIFRLFRNIIKNDLFSSVKKC